MKYKIRRLIANIVGWILVIIYMPLEKRKAFSGKYITCIYFHDPGTSIFEKCIKWLKKKGFNFISTEEVIKITKGESKVIPGSIWITFDDGWLNNLKIVPIAQRYDVPINIFIATDSIEKTGYFWWTLARKYQAQLPDEYRDNINLLWKIDNLKKMEIINKLIDKVSPKMEREAINIKELVEISKIPQVTIGSHTVYHSIIPNCNPEEMKDELKISKEKLEQWINKPVTSFSYPNGDFNGKEKPVFIESGYDLAVTSVQRYYEPLKDDPFYIPRFCTSENSGLSVNICKMFGIWGRFFKG
jgi:poly-beta-1,6-N-acetyl-D-glucosamine N-deacetylase